MNARRRRQIARGAHAEKQVFRILRELGNDYAVFNGVAARYGDIDHVVIRRDGAVFLIETKSHHGNVTYDGKRLLLNGHTFEKDFIAQINRNIPWLWEKIRLATGVNVWIVAVLVFINGIVYSDKGKSVLRLRPVKRVNVVTGRSLRSLFASYAPETPRGEVWDNLDVLQAVL